MRVRHLVRHSLELPTPVRDHPSRRGGGGGSSAGYRLSSGRVLNYCMCAACLLLQICYLVNLTARKKAEDIVERRALGAASLMPVIFHPGKAGCSVASSILGDPYCFA